jgi:hypothetical protein
MNFSPLSDILTELDCGQLRDGRGAQSAGGRSELGVDGRLGGRPNVSRDEGRSTEVDSSGECVSSDKCGSFNRSSIPPFFLLCHPQRLCMQPTESLVGRLGFVMKH